MQVRPVKHVSGLYLKCIPGEKEVTNQTSKPEVIEPLDGFIEVIAQACDILTKHSRIIVTDCSWNSMGNHCRQRVVQDVCIQTEHFI